MASRKDKKGRVLQKGEYQRSNGTYQYSYYDITGKRRYQYSKDLMELRKKEKEYMFANWQGADAYGVSVTLNSMYDRYMATKFGLRESTYCSYLQMYDRYVRDEFGQQSVKHIRHSDILAFYTYLIKDKKLGIRSVEYVHDQIRPALELAVQDGLIVRNPATHAFGNFKKSSGLESNKKKALTLDEQKLFLEYTSVRSRIIKD